VVVVVVVFMFVVVVVMVDIMAVQQSLRGLVFFLTKRWSGLELDVEGCRPMVNGRERTGRPEPSRPACRQ